MKGTTSIEALLLLAAYLSLIVCFAGLVGQLEKETVSNSKLLYEKTRLENACHVISLFSTNGGNMLFEIGGSGFVAKNRTALAFSNGSASSECLKRISVIKEIGVERSGKEPS